MKLTTKHFQPKYHLDIKPATSNCARRLFNPKYQYVIDYDIVLSNGKNLQRDFVWTIEQKRSLIISMLKELQIPNFAVVFYNPEGKMKDVKGIFRIVDGKQRLKTIEQFINNEFSLLVDNVEYFYDDLEQLAQFRIIDCTLLFNIIYEYDDVKLSDEQLISWFELVNFAGTPQDIEHLDKLKS